MTLNRNAYELANDTGVSCPDTPDSPGAKFLLGVQDAVSDAWEHADPEFRDAYYHDAVHEIADGAVPIYTYEKWQTFVDLAAWQEDLTDWTGERYEEPLDHLSNIALYQIAERLALVLFEEASQA